MEKKNKAALHKTNLQLRLKILIYITMIIIVCTLLLERALLKGVALGTITILGIIAVDIRQINREMSNILKKLYICIDLEAYDLMSEGLCSNLIVPVLRNKCRLFFKLLKNYYQHLAIDSDWFKLKLGITLPIIKIYSQLMTGDKIKNKIIDDIDEKFGIDFISRHLKILEAQGLNSKERYNELLNLRENAENNLQFAQINYLLSRVEGIGEDCKYYRKIANNIAPQIYDDI